MKTTGFLLLMLCTALPLILYAGTTGKISGRVTDAESGKPLFGVNVIVEGTGLGAATDMNGDYQILYLNPGKYTVKAMMIGYKTVTVRDVNVMVDLTTTLDFQMSVVTLKGEEVVVIAEKPVVQMDVTSTSFRVGSEQINQLQVQELDDIINLQAGVVEGHFRGGRSGEVTYIVDGVPINDDYSGDISFDVENDVIQEVEVISGTFNAEYGQAMSGIVNIVTKEGGNRFSGKISAFIGDYLSNHDNIFMNISDLEPSDIYNSQISLSGPVPFMAKKVTFSILGRFFHNEGWIYGKRDFMPSDFVDFNDPAVLDTLERLKGSGDGQYVSMNPSTRKTLQGKITFKLFSLDKLNISTFIQNQQFRDFDRLFKYNPEGNYQKLNNSYQNSLQYTHLFSPETFVTANLSESYTKFSQYVYKDTSRYVPLENLTSTGATGFSTGGMRMWRHFRSNRIRILKLDLSSQATKNHKIGAGINLKKSRLKLHEYWLYFDENDILRVPPDSSWYNNSYLHEPMEISAYLQDKIEFGDMIINAGLRYDYFDPDGVVPAQFYNTRDAEKRRAKSSYQISPRLGIAYPISDQGVVHFSYGHFFQIPNYEYLYINPDFEVSLIQLSGDQPPRGRFNLMGNAELKPEKTVSYEIGIKQALSQNFTIDITAYNKDIRDLIGQETRSNIYGGKYWRFINRDYANVKGITVALEKRELPGSPGFTLDYTYQVAAGNASDPNDEWLNQQQDPPIEGEKKRNPLDWDQTHSLNLTATSSINGFHWSLIGQLGSGTPYTRASARYSNRVVNGERKPMTISFDLNITRDFRIGSVHISPYLKIYNLFDRLNNREVYASSGTADYDYDLNFQTYIGIKDQNEWAIRPDFYSEPRKIYVGCSVSF